MRRRTLALAVVMLTVSAGGTATAATPASLFDGQLTCGEVTDEGSGGGVVTSSLGQVWCGTVRAADNINSTVSPPIATIRSTVKTFDGVPLDVNVGFPNATTFGPPPYPTVLAFHGYGGFRYRFKDMQRWLDKGYAVYSLTQRGFDESCLTPDSKLADPAGCANGYIHLLDQRHEIRDSQNFVGELVDDGLVIPDKLAAVGSSYGGGTSVSLAALKNRMMEPDGSLIPWTSPSGTPISLAVATPNVPPTELPYILAPSGGDIDYISDSSYSYVTADGRKSRAGILKEGWVQGLSATGFVSPIGTDPTSDLLGWKAAFDEGEPYDNSQVIADSLAELEKFHSPYGIDHSVKPAPMMISAGYTDDLVPVNEETRFYNRTRDQYPDLPFTLFFGSLGHPRGQVQANVTSALRAKEDQWIDHYLGGVGAVPPSEVISYTQTCPGNPPAGGPYTAADWASISPGEIRLEDPEPQTIAASGGDPGVSTAWNSLFAGQDPCGVASGAAEPGSANYLLPPAPAGGYTVQGAPTLVANVDLGASTDSQIAARLVDLSPSGTEKTLVARGLWRPWAEGLQVFQLFANAWKVEEGHVLRLELLPKDASAPAGTPFANYGRPTDGQGDIEISKLDLRIPVVESPGALNGLVAAPAKKVLPDRQGVELAPGNESIGSQTLEQYREEMYPVIGKIKVLGATVKGKTLTARISCAAANDRCADAKVQFKGAPKKGKGKGVVLATKSNVRAAAGKTVSVRFNLTAKARKLFKDSKKKVRKRGKVRVVKVKGLKSLRTNVLIGGKSAGFITVKRNGKVN